MRACRDFTDSAATHDSEPWLFGDFVHAPAIVTRSLDAGSSNIIPESYEISSHMPLGQQRSLAQTGAYNDRFVDVSMYKTSK